MKQLWIVAMAGCALLAMSATPAHSQNFLMNSAETINKGNFKIAAFPTVLFGEGAADDSWGVGTRLGYGFTNNFDVEAKLGFFDSFNFYGIDGELWVIKGPVDVSLALGGHFTDQDGGSDSKAIDVAGIVSGNVASKLELYGGVSLSFESLDDSDRDFTRTYLVPGFEYKVSDSLDVDGEVGIGLGDDSPSYVAVGLSFYVR